MLWPTKLAVFYPHPWHTLQFPDVAASTVILVAITVAVLYRHRSRYLVTGWFLFVTTLIPVIGIIQVGRQAMADRYTYVPCIGLFIIIAWGLDNIIPTTAKYRFGPALAALFIVLAFTATTRDYLPYWQNGVDLFMRAGSVAGQPDFMIEEGLAENLDAGGRSNEALPHYKEACRLRPDYARCHGKLAELLLRRALMP